jgi:tetratricopeptide (TPR) repeat protein
VADAQQIQQALEALQAGRVPEARVLLERSVGASPMQGDAWALLARTYLQLKEPGKAAAAAKRAEAAGIEKLSPETWHSLALYHAQSGNRKRAAELEGLYAASPKADSAAAARAALLCYEVGDIDNAIRFGEIAAEPDRQPKPEVILALAKALEAKKRTGPALARYKQLAELRPYDEETLSLTSQAMLRMASFTEAVPFLESAVGKFDRSPQLQLSLGVAYYGQRRFLDAGRSFLKTIDLDPSIEQPYAFLARIVDQLEPLWPEMSRRFTEWHAKESRSHLPPFVLARFQTASGSGESSATNEKLLRESIRRNPKFWESHFELGSVLESRRDFAGAAAEFEQSAQLSPTQAEVYYRLSRIYTRLNQPAKAAQARAQHQKLTSPNSGVGGSGMSDGVSK